MQLNCESVASRHMLSVAMHWEVCHDIAYSPMVVGCWKRATDAECAVAVISL